MATENQSNLAINTKVVAEGFNHYNISEGKVAINCTGNSFTENDNFKFKLAQINVNRWTQGKPPLSNIQCYKCKAINSHFTSDCPNQKCYICKGNHNTKYCKYRIECQFCNSTAHSTFQCTTETAIKKRRFQISICYICKKKGHIASECKGNFNQNNYNYFSRRNRFSNNYNYYNNRGFKNFNFSYRKRYNSYNNYNNYSKRRKWF